MTWVISTGKTLVHKASDCFNDEKMTLCVDSNVSGVKMLEFLRRDMLLRYKAYANTKVGAVQSMVCSEVAFHSVRCLNFIPNR